MATRLERLEGVWVFNALTYNRDVPASVIAMVAATKDHAEKMAESFMQAAATMLGKPRDVASY
jgi:hypothetical protein